MPAAAGQQASKTASTMTVAAQAQENQMRKMLTLFREESAKCENWKSKYIADSLFVLGSGAYGSVFQVTTRLYNSKQKLTKNRQMYHPNFISTMASQRRVRPEMQEKLKDPNRDTSLLDIVAIKYEILQQTHLEDGATRFFLFLRREFIVLDALWRKSFRIMHGFPAVFDFDYVGDKGQFGVNSKYRNIFTYLNIEGEEVKFFTDVHNRNLENVTKISYMSMELVGPSIDDIRYFYEPWFSEVGMRTFFNVRTAFMLADQILCRLLVLHRSGFVHHDIKPDNIALGNGRAMNVVYLLDFGFAKQVSNNRPPEWMGSRKFISIDTYSGAKTNYAQDIESWFYLVISFLYDDLPWTDDHLTDLLGDQADENARWNLVSQMKKTWWGDPSEATSLSETFKMIAGLHSKEIPDIKQIMEQLHKRTRDLRAVMRSQDDAQTLNFELANNQSALFKGYMSIRKVLLQIFKLPNIGDNAYLCDAEFRSLLETREEKNLPQFEWDPKNYHWEWDDDHHRLWHQDGAAKIDANNAEDVQSFKNQHSSYGRIDALRSLLVMDRSSRVERPDEISYVFDRESGLLRPKASGMRRLGQPPVPFHANLSATRDYEGDWSTI
ncbi:hypothetical protein BOX15_Mlig018370g1 [Macrostomum lignano]|uniref:Protein kinase domain-containing protein n=2 Tax=Macrostomum lignano TaxID=282301 RepID=A0A1I8H6H3_9PLAT|nr:hypothetical protein BOX15_Mlig018370g2 [Macrostomum lignano]PAA57930.1 hypothetical protein BOX15_Mlig018370g1 [Macrostomum lignano]